MFYMLNNKINFVVFCIFYIHPTDLNFNLYLFLIKILLKRPAIYKNIEHHKWRKADKLNKPFLQTKKSIQCHCLSIIVNIMFAHSLPKATS